MRFKKWEPLLSSTAMIFIIHILPFLTTTFQPSIYYFQPQPLWQECIPQIPTLKQFQFDCILTQRSSKYLFVIESKLLFQLFNLAKFLFIKPTMKLLTSMIITAFFIYYYFVLAFTISLNIIKKICSCLIVIKHKPKIHPYHNAHEGVFAGMEQFIYLEGFSLDQYRFETEDKASVHFWRIRKEEVQVDKPYPIVIMHGLLQSSSTWFLTQKMSNCLPYLLAKDGYDVWVGNNRGNRVSQQPQKNYQNYTIDDLVQYDQPSIINGVLQTTNKEKVIYIGHSQGSTQLLLALGVHPQLKNKIAAFIGLGTVVSLSGVTQNPVLNFISKVYFFQLLLLLGYKELIILSQSVSKAIGILIYNSKFHTDIIMGGIKKLIGVNQGNIPHQMIGVIFTQEPGGGSVNNVLHWIQCFRGKGRFHKFCFGKRRNLQIYGSHKAPQYCLKHLKCLQFNSYIFRGQKDALNSQQDFCNLTTLFDQQKITTYRVKDYNHLDYLWGQRVHEDIYSQILNIINNGL